MVIEVNFRALTISKKETIYKKKDGTDGIFYRLALEKEGDVCNMNCNQEAFDKLQRLEEAEITAHFNTDYNTIRITDLSYV